MKKGECHQWVADVKTRDALSKKLRRNSTTSHQREAVPSKPVRGIAGLLAHVLTPGQQGLEQPTRLEREEMASRNHRVALSRSVRVHSHELD